MKEGTNYARFYALLKKLKGADKETLVYQFTNGRTEHLRLMTDAEYGWFWTCFYYFHTNPD